MEAARAYNFFESGYVRTVYAMAFGQGVLKCILVKAKVNPSQRSPDDAHEAWIIVGTSIFDVRVPKKW